MKISKLWCAFKANARAFVARNKGGLAFVAKGSLFAMSVAAGVSFGVSLATNTFAPSVGWGGALLAHACVGVGTGLFTMASTFGQAAIGFGVGCAIKKMSADKSMALSPLGGLAPLCFTAVMCVMGFSSGLRQGFGVASDFVSRKVEGVKVTSPQACVEGPLRVERRGMDSWVTLRA